MGGEPGADGVEVAAQQRIGVIAALAQRDAPEIVLQNDPAGIAEAVKLCKGTDRSCPRR